MRLKRYKCMSKQWTIFIYFFCLSQKNFISSKQSISLHFIILKQNSNTNKCYLYLDKINRKNRSVFFCPETLRALLYKLRVSGKYILCSDSLQSLLLSVYRMNGNWMLPLYKPVLYRYEVFSGNKPSITWTSLSQTFSRK